MRERPHGMGSRRRSPSPRRPLPRSRDFSPSRHQKFSPYHRRETDEYSRESKTARRIEKRDHLDRDSSLRDPRFSEYDNRVGDRYAVDGRGFSSPRRMEKRDNLNKPVSLSGYGDGVGCSKRSYAALDSHHGDASSRKFQGDHLIDGPRKSEYFIGDTDIITGGERDYYRQKRYRDSGQAGLVPVAQCLDGGQPAPVEFESGGRMYSRSYTLGRGGVDDNLTCGDGISCMSTVASHYLNTDMDKQRYFQNRDEPHLERRDGLHVREDNYSERKADGFHSRGRLFGVEKMLDGEIYKFKKEENLLPSRSYMKDDSEYMASPSLPIDCDPVPSSETWREGFPGYSATRDLHTSSDMIRRGNGLASKPIGLDGYSEKRQNMFPRGHGGQLDDTSSSPSSYVRLPEGRWVDRSYAEFGRSNTENITSRLNDGEEGYRDQYISRADVLSHVVDGFSLNKHAEFGRSNLDNISSRLNDSEEGYRDHFMSRGDVLRHAVDEVSHRKHLGDDGLWDLYPSRVQSTPGKFDERESLNVGQQNLDMLRTGGSRLNDGTEGYYGYECVKPEEHHADVAGGEWSHFEMSDMVQSRGYGHSFAGLNDNPRSRLPVSDSTLVEPSDRKMRDRHVMDDILYENDYGIRISVDGNGARKIYNQVNLEGDIDPVHFSKHPRSSRLDYEKTWRLSSETANDQPSSSKFQPHHSIKPHKSDSRDIKKRLGPVHQNLHVSQRLVNKYKPSVKKRLAPARPMKQAAPPWLKNKSSNTMGGHQKDSDGGAQDHDGDHLGDHPPLTKPEPPEKSEDFKQLVKSAFFKFLKQINETPMKRKKYMEQGKAGILKCIVCGSNSDEFVGTECLAMHAFTSKKVGLRSQHLGLHKALCALMGWKIAEEPSSEWHCEVMTNAETSSLKEDLIIWPPVVIVHNSTVDNMSPDERVIISTERLDTKFRDMGFGSILKVCNGKPANQSVMVVKFSGTLSGLQEAERLHQSFVESLHGKAELKQLKESNSRSSKEGTQVMSAEREYNFLYGHLGIVEDLDKLDFDTKKRCFLRSKKQVLSIADLPIDSEGQCKSINQ